MDSPTTLIEVGRFTYDTATDVLTGPKDFLLAQGGAQAAAERAINSATFRYGASEQPNPYILLLVCLQTEYAGWEGARRFNARLAS